MLIGERIFQIWSLKNSLEVGVHSVVKFFEILLTLWGCNRDPSGTVRKMGLTTVVIGLLAKE